VFERKRDVPSYQPINLPATYTIEQGPAPPAPADSDPRDSSTIVATDHVPA
jgi:hypothetical protein